MLRNERLAQVITSEESMATTLLMACVDQFSTEFFDWEPETFDIECVRAFGIEMPEENRDKVWALVTALTTNLFYISLETFIPTCNSLNGSEADFAHYDPVTGEEAAWGIYEVLLHDPVDKGENPGDRFSHEIKSYVALTLSTEGVTTPPAILKPFTEYERDPEEPAGAVIGPDEHMLDMYTDRQTRQRDEITQYVRNNLQQLSGQLRHLPLANGDTSQILGYLERSQQALLATLQPEPLATPSVL